MAEQRHYPGTSSNTSTPDYYKVLQVDPMADAEVIDAAYRRLARKYHPDVYKGADAEERIRSLNAAHDVLCNPAQRASYDETRRRVAAAPPVQSRSPASKQANAPSSSFQQPASSASPGTSVYQQVTAAPAQTAKPFSSSKIVHLLAFYPFARVIILVDLVAIGISAWLGWQSLWPTVLSTGGGVVVFLLSASLTKNNLVVGVAGIWAAIWWLICWRMTASGLVLPLGWPVGGLLLAFLAFLIHLLAFWPALLPGLAAFGRTRPGR